MGQVIIPPGFAEVIMHIKTPVGGKDPMCVFGVGVDVLQPIADMADQLQIAFVAFADAFLEGYGCTHLTFRLGDPAPPYASFDIPIAVDGSGSDPTSPQVAVLVKKTSLVAGRQGRGRTYLPGFVSDGFVEDDGSINGTAVGAVQSSVDALRTALYVEPLLGFYILHGEGTSLADTPTEVVNWQVESKVATQRRRLR